MHPAMQRKEAWKKIMKAYMVASGLCMTVSVGALQGAVLYG